MQLLSNYQIKQGSYQKKEATIKIKKEATMKNKT
jgi:hypothetical protein